jgi:hypothetical protein
MKKIRVLYAAALVLSLASPTLAATGGPVAFLRKIDRQLCASFKSLKCTRGKRRVHGAPKIKIAKPLQAPKAIELKPVVKPQAPLPKKTAAVLPPVKPLIQPKPVGVVAAVPAKVIIPPPVIIPKKQIEPVVIKPPAPVTPSLSSDATCTAALKAKDVDFDVVAQPVAAPACDVQQPVQLKSMYVAGVAMQFPDQPILNCAFALTFVDWLRDVGGPAATRSEGFALTQFYTGPGFQCRGRNGDITAKISEHGHGNAVDVERIKFSDGRMFAVHDALDPASPAFETLKAIRTSACARFTTVLGPGSNAAHREHFHFDSGIHGKSGTYTICE